MKGQNFERYLPVNSAKICRDEVKNVWVEEIKVIDELPSIIQEKHLKSCDRILYEKLKQEQQRLLGLSQEIGKITETNKDTIKT